LQSIVKSNCERIIIVRITTTRSLLLAPEAAHFGCSGWDWIDDANYSYLFLEYKGDKLDFVFKYFKAGRIIASFFKK